MLFGSLNFSGITDLLSAATHSFTSFCLSNVNLIFMSQDLSHFSCETFLKSQTSLAAPLQTHSKKEYMFLYNIYILILISEFILF